MDFHLKQATEDFKTLGRHDLTKDFSDLINVLSKIGKHIMNYERAYCLVEESLGEIEKELNNLIKDTELILKKIDNNKYKNFVISKEKKKQAELFLANLSKQTEEAYADYDWSFMDKPKEE